jgi:signal peptidase II
MLNLFKYRHTGLPWCVLSLVVIGLDQWSKLLVLKHLLPYESVRLMPVLNLTLAYNQGAAFSFLSDAVVISAGLLVWMARLPRAAYWQNSALAFILGGALSNVLDRVRLGYVIDFIDCHWGHYHWPIFNVADSAITLGVVLLILHAWIGSNSGG